MRLAVAVAVAVALALVLSARPAGAEECALEERDIRWLQTALDNWSILRRDILEAKAAPLP